VTSPFRLVGTVVLGRGVINTFERDHLLAADGSGIRRDRLTHPGAVVVVPVGERGIWLIHQYRPAIREWTWELPAGLREPGETPFETGLRECIEEVGLEPGRLETIGRLVSSPGILDEHVDVFRATELRDVGRRPDDHEERLATVKEVPFNALAHMLAEGTLGNAITIAGLARAGFAAGVRWADQ
jgi:ADP-ribose pyrophosphatase